MKFPCKITAACLFAFSLTLNSCASLKYDYNSSDGQGGANSSGGELDRDIVSFLNSENENKTYLYRFENETVARTYQAEEKLGLDLFDGLPDYRGKGYVTLSAGKSASFSADIPASQHYIVGLRICSERTTVTLAVNGQTVGAYYAEKSLIWNEFNIDGVYMASGNNQLTFTCENGTAYIDEIVLTNAGAPNETRFNVATVTADRQASKSANRLMLQLTQLFGKKILLSQLCTPDTNAEINAIYAVTGREPAIRAGDLKYYSRYYDGAEKGYAVEIELSQEWAKKGGIVQLGWSWYSPSLTGKSHYLASESGFDFTRSFVSDDLSLISLATLAQMRDEGKIPAETFELVADIDAIAAALRPLAEADIPVLWKPLSGAGFYRYWYDGAGPAAYRWLWKLVMNRMVSLHGIHNLIYVWSGVDKEFYPGDEYVDIVAADIMYNTSDVSNVGAFTKLTAFTSRRMLSALTESVLLPDPDLLWRDRIMWSFITLGRGDALIDGNGQFSDNQPNSTARLIKIYNHELTVTLDEYKRLRV